MEYTFIRGDILGKHFIFIRHFICGDAFLCCVGVEEVFPEAKGAKSIRFTRNDEEGVTMKLFINKEDDPESPGDWVEEWILWVPSLQKHFGITQELGNLLMGDCGIKAGSVFGVTLEILE